MNYVPGTASLIDDIDSKLERMIRCSLVDGDGLVKTRLKMWHRVSCNRLNVFVFGCIPQRSTWCCSEMAER